MKRLLAGAATLPLALTGCGGSSTGQAGTQQPAQAARACDGRLESADPTAAIPAGFPVLAGQVLVETHELGKTTVVLAQADGAFLAVRDDLVDKLKAGGYTIVGTDQEPVEAEAEFEGTLDGTIKVTPLCVGKVDIRYKFLG